MPLLRKISALVLALFIMITVMTPFSYVKAETITSVELIKNGDFSSRDFWVFTPNACANHSACNNMHIDGAGFLYFQWNQTTRSDYVRQIIQPTVPLGEEDDMVFSYQIKDSYNGRDARAQIKIGEKIITKEELSSNTQFPQKNVFYTRTFQFKAKELCGSLSNCEEYLRNGFQIEIEARRGARGDTDFQIDNMSLRKTHTFYDVIFRDGGQELQNTSVAKGAQITAPVNPSRPGMVFAGWEKVGTSQIFTSFGASDIALADVTFEAEWNYTPMQAQDQTLRLSAGAIPAIETFVANRSELATDAQFEWKEGAPNFDRTSVQSQTRTLVYKHNAVVVNEVPVTINFMDDIQPEISDQTFVLFEGDLPAGGVSVSASDNIGLTNYTAGVSFAGLNLSNAGVVDGTVSTAHARSHEITVADAAGNEKKANLTLDVLSFPKVVLTPKIYGQEQYSQDEIISAIKNVHHAKGLLDSYYTNREI